MDAEAGVPQNADSHRPTPEEADGLAEEAIGWKTEFGQLPCCLAGGRCWQEALQVLWEVESGQTDSYWTLGDLAQSPRRRRAASPGLEVLCVGSMMIHLSVFHDTGYVVRCGRTNSVIAVFVVRWKM